MTEGFVSMVGVYCVRLHGVLSVVTVFPRS